MNRRCLVAIFFGALVLADPAAGQDTASLRGDSAQTRKRLAEVEQKMLAGKAADAADDLQRVLDEAGEDLISVDGKQYRSARWIAHGILARLPEAALRSYQDRIDEPARKLLAAAKRTNDAAPLWELLDRYFVSRPADEALLMLGDLLFERGEFRAAERTWQRLLPDGAADIAYPASRQDPAQVRARVVLALIYQHDLDRAARELATFRKRHPDANGTFAGKTGLFAETLQGWLDHPPAVSPAANAGANWPTFAGGPDRSGRVAARLSGEWPSRPTWNQKLETGLRHDEAPIGPPRRPPFSHPVATLGHVFVTDGSNVFGFQLSTGRKIPPLELASTQNPGGGKTAPPDPCPTLSASGDRLYVRIGPGVIKPASGKENRQTSIACVRVVVEPDGSCTLKEQWRLGPPPAEDADAGVWEGAPVASGRRMWATFARFEGGRVVHTIACYDPNDASTAPERPVWTADVCDGPVIGGEGRARHELLTLSGRHIVFCSNTGAVVALDAATGRRAWGFRYARSRQSDAAHSPHPTPPVGSGGRLFVSPADGEAVYALDPESGQVLWQSKPMTGARILAVSAGHLIVAVDGPVRGICGLSLGTGSARPPEGWIQHDGTGLLGYGQGFVTDDVIVWPTRSGLLFLRSTDGVPLAETRPSPLMDANSNYFGNIVYADGAMVVVGPTSVWGYVSQAREFPSSRSHSDPSRVEFERVIRRTEDALARGEPGAARRLLSETARGPLPKHYRAWAVARLFLLTSQAREPARLPAQVEAVVAAGLRDEWLFDSSGFPTTLQAWLDRQLGRERQLSPTPFAPKRCLREAADAITLHRGSDIVRTLKLPGGSAPLRRISGAPARPERLFLATATELLAVSTTGGELSRFASPGGITHAAEFGDGFMAAGPSIVALYGSDRAPSWIFRVPMTDPLPARTGTPFLSSGSEPAIPELGAFQLNGNLLFARLGERHLIAIDLEGKQVAWVLGADGTSGFSPTSLPGALRFGPSFGVAARHLLVQLSDGRRWIVAADTGKLAASTERGERTTNTWWRQGPCEVEANTVSIPDGAGLVRLVDLAAGVEKWKHQLEGETSLAGEPPQLASWPDTLVLAARRNHGVELDRLDLHDGKSLWTSGPAFLDADDVVLANADADCERIVMPVGDSLVAISLETGKTLWKARLPDTQKACGWVVRLGRDCAIAYPEAAVPREPLANVLGRLFRSFGDEPGLARLPGLVGGAYDAWVARSVPVVLLDPDTGKRLVRFDIPARGPAITASFERDLAVVVTGDRVVWLR